MKEIFEKLATKQDLSEGEIEGVFNRILNGELTESQIAALLLGLKMKGETVDEIVGVVKSLKKHAVQLPQTYSDAMCNCGTGGDQSYSFNISTTACFILAAGGIRLAKAGNRSISSKSGSEEKALDLTTRDIILNIGSWLYSLGDAVTGNTTSPGLATLLQNNFNTVVVDVRCGPITYDSIRRLPAWVSYKLRNSTVETEIKVWLNDTAFQSEYEPFIIKIIPPFENIDQFFMPTPELKELVAKINPIELADRINEARGDYPDTMLRAESTTYINPSNINDTITVYWHAIIYGKAGDDSSLIRQAIIEYIAANSRSSENEWKTILPDLFNVTAFYVLPRWDKYAIPSRRTIPGIYSPITNHREVVSFVEQKLNGMMSKSHIEQNLEITTHRYKSLTLTMIGGEDNRRGLFKISDYYNDYIGEETTNEDFNRQKESTKQWTNMITELLMKAENYENNPTLPSSTRLVSRNGLSFLVRKFENIEYYVALKSNYSTN